MPNQIVAAIMPSPTITDMTHINLTRVGINSCLNLTTTFEMNQMNLRHVGIADFVAAELGLDLLHLRQKIPSIPNHNKSTKAMRPSGQLNDSHADCVRSHRANQNPPPANAIGKAKTTLRKIPGPDMNRVNQRCFLATRLRPRSLNPTPSVIEQIGINNNTAERMPTTYSNRFAIRAANMMNASTHQIDSRTITALTKKFRVQVATAVQVSTPRNPVLGVR